MNNSTSPRFMDMTPDELRAAYRDARNGAASWADLGNNLPRPNRRTRGRIAGGVFANLDRLDLIVNVARKRGIRLVGEA